MRASPSTEFGDLFEMKINVELVLWKATLEDLIEDAPSSAKAASNFTQTVDYGSFLLRFRQDSRASFGQNDD